VALVADRPGLDWSEFATFIGSSPMGQDTLEFASVSLIRRRRRRDSSSEGEANKATHSDGKSKRVCSG